MKSLNYGETLRDALCVKIFHMQNDDAQNLIRMFGGMDALVSVLRITELPEELQLEIVTRFSENIFKRILLHVPKEHIGRVIDVLDAHADDGNDFEELVIVLDQHIPNMEDAIREEVERAVEQFRLTIESSSL